MSKETKHCNQPHIFCTVCLTGEILCQVSVYGVSDTSLTVVRFGVTCLYLQRLILVRF